jgi:hypothetical protein
MTSPVTLSSGLLMCHSLASCYAISPLLHVFRGSTQRPTNRAADNAPTLGILRSYVPLASPVYQHVKLGGRRARYVHLKTLVPPLFLHILCFRELIFGGMWWIS